MKSLGYSQHSRVHKHHLPYYLPDFFAESILEIDFDKLKKIGVTHLLIDLDQTVRHRHSQEISDEIIQYLYAAVNDIGFNDICIVTNNRRDIQQFGNILQAKIFQPYKNKSKTIRKPNQQFFENVLKVANIQPRHAVMIGDKLQFDIAGANRAGIHTIYVNPLGKDYWYDHLFFTRARDKRKLSSAKVKGGLFSTKGTELHLKEALQQVDFNAKKVQTYKVDARGSIPFVATDGKRKVFIKLITRKTNLFDWFFKFGRRILFGRLEDEMPYVSPRQAVEHEAYISSLALKAGVRTPQVLGQIDLHDHRHALVTRFIDAKPIDIKQSKKLTDTALIDLWSQIKKLHKAHIAHRDLRTANILIDNKKRVWLIDYDFATTAATIKNLQKDNVELLVSLATIVGAKKSIKFASTALTPRDYRELLPLLRYGTLSSATRGEARKNKNILKNLRDFVEVLSVKSDSY